MAGSDTHKHKRLQGFVAELHWPCVCQQLTVGSQLQVAFESLSLS